MPSLTMLFILVASLVGCSSKPPKEYPEIYAEKPYRETYAVIKKYIQTCLPGVKLNANLFTDVPEAELVIDYIPPTPMLAPGSFETRRELVNIHLYGSDNKTRILTKSDIGQGLAKSALAGNPCPKAK